MTSLLQPAICLSQVSLLIPIVVWILSIRSASRTLQLIFLGIIVSLLEEIVNMVTALLFGSNFISINLFALPILMIFTLAYYLHEDFTPPVRRAIGITGTAGCISLVVYYFLYPLNKYLDIVQWTYAATLVIIALCYFVHKVFYTDKFEIAQHALFFISSAIFLYNFAGMVILTSYNLFSGEEMEAMWILGRLVYTLYNCMIAYGFYIYKRYAFSL